MSEETKTKIVEPIEPKGDDTPISTAMVIRISQMMLEESYLSGYQLADVAEKRAEDQTRYRWYIYIVLAGLWGSVFGVAYIFSFLVGLIIGDIIMYQPCIRKKLRVTFEERFRKTIKQEEEAMDA